MRGRRHESIQDRINRYRGVLMVVSVPVILILAILFFMPRASQYPGSESGGETGGPQHSKSGKAVSGEAKYGVIFDAGSTGSRVHVFKFDSGAHLLEINGELELFQQLKPGLSSFANDPLAAAESLKPLLAAAMEVVPENKRTSTKMALRATAGLRLLPGSQAENILAEVRKLFKTYPFPSDDDSVSILDGHDEGAFAWVTVNYLLGRLGGPAVDTVGVVDLGGGSVQITHAVDDATAKSAPDGYIRRLNGNGKTYNVYVHSFLGYGLMAARAAVLEADAEDDGHDCLFKGYKANYTYANKNYQAAARAKGSSFEDCAAVVNAALHPEKECEVKTSCSFNGVWSANPAKATKEWYLASYFTDRAAQVGLKEAEAAMGQADIESFQQAGQKACGMSLEDAAKEFPSVETVDLPFLCLDISYIHALMTKGFRLPSDAPFKLVKRIAYDGKEVEAAWPLGAVINDLA